MMRLLQIVEQLMQAHLKALKDLGIDLEAEAKKAEKKPLEASVKRGA